MYLRLHLRFLRLRPGNPNPTASALPSCPLCYSLPCRNHGRPIIKGLWQKLLKLHLRQITILLIHCPYYPLMVDLAGVEPASRTLFSLLHTAITFLVLTNFLGREGPLSSLLSLSHQQPRYAGLPLPKYNNYNTFFIYGQPFQKSFL